MIGSLVPVGSDPPERRREDYDRQKKEDAHHLEPDDAADPAKWTQEATDAAHHSTAGETGCAPCCSRVCFPDGSGPVQPIRSKGFRGGICRGRLAAGGQTLPGDSAGDTQADSQCPTDTLRSHFVMMVAAAVDELYFFDLIAVHSWLRMPIEVRYSYPTPPPAPGSSRWPPPWRFQ